VGYFSITNPDPTSPICSVEINPTPGGSFSTGNLWIDGDLSGQSWTSSNIPSSGNLIPEAYNSIDFILEAKGYKGTVEVCITKCDSTVCCFEVNWNKRPVIDADIEAGDINIGNKLLAVSVSHRKAKNMQHCLISTLYSKVKCLSLLAPCLARKATSSIQEALMLFHPDYPMGLTMLY
jgi:hypothetical protein